MNLQYRIDLLVGLGQYMLSDDEQWQSAQQRAGYANGWFTPEFIRLSIENITTSYLDRNNLKTWVENYEIPVEQSAPKTVGIVMAGNIPLVGFHDLMTVFISGHKAMIKPSSKDEILIRHLVEKLIFWEPAAEPFIQFSTMLRGCDAYIATGSNNSSRYFDYYFGKYPNVIRSNRSSMAVLNGEETKEELQQLADDFFQYFGLGCRNVTKLLVPENYDFVPLLEAFKKYSYLEDHHKYKNNYDYNLALLILNKQFYMTNGSILLVENPSLFSPIAQLNYSYYKSQDDLNTQINTTESLQCIVGKNFVPFGKAQKPAVDDYADGVDTLNFLLRL